MAYYDMANDQDGWPELQVRFDYAVANDPYFPSYFYAGTIETPNLEVCYSWDQDNDNRWDYKMELGANYPIDEVVAFPDFAVKSVPYEQIVPWVKDRTWDVAMLVFDQNPSPDSEGMYGKGWHIDRGYVDGKNVEPSGVKSQYLVGLSDQPPLENYQDIQEGMRGEYSFQYFDTPKMYLSALDRQLHLYGAQAGVWNLGAGHYLRYANLDGDAYLDQWQEQRDGSVVQQLNYTNGNLVYSGNGGVLLQHTSASPALFESPPPGNYEEWQRLDESLKANQAAFSPQDFTGMLDQFSGAQMQIQGATLRDFRVTPQGFRFILTLPPGFKIAGPDWLGLAGKAPGDYLVTYDGAYQVAPAAPPELQFAAPLQISPERAHHRLRPAPRPGDPRQSGPARRPSGAGHPGHDRARAGDRLDRAADRHRACRGNHARAFHLGARFPWGMELARPGALALSQYRRDQVCRC